MTKTSDDDMFFGVKADSQFGFQSPGVLITHSADKCAGRPCCLHNPSDHHMKDWPTVWRDDRYLMERVCPEHGVGHPDPDHMAYVRTQPHLPSDGAHGCCGCCREGHVG